MTVFKGTAWKFDDDIDTDQIYPGKYLPLTDKDEMGKVAMSGVDVVTLQYAGVSVVIAKSFARIFYRNAVNLGYPILETDAVDEIGQGDRLEVDADAGVIRDLTSGKDYQCTTLSGLERDISAAGGLIPYLNKELKG